MKYIYRYIEIWCWTNGFGIPHSQTNPMSQRKRWEMYSIILIVWDNKCVYISIYTKKNMHLGPQEFQFSLKKWRDHDQNITVKHINYTFLTFSVGCCVPEASYDWTEKSDTERNPSGFVLPMCSGSVRFCLPGTLPVLYLHPWENRSVNILALGFTCT